MQLNTFKIHLFLLYNLPIAFLAGVRLKSIDDRSCVVSVRHRWINQNPFKSMYFAVQLMAGELSTGALLIAAIKKNGRSFSTLVTANSSKFTKKAVGTIIFTCRDGGLIASAVKRAIEDNEKQILILRSVAFDEAGDKVCEMEFEWNIKLRTK